MSDTPDNASDAGSIDQSAIDALFGGGSEEATGAPKPEPAGELDQSDIDAPLADGSPDSPAPAAEPEPVGGAIDQGDIDALMAAAGGGDTSPPAEDASAPDPDNPDTRLDSMGRPFDEVAAAMQAAIEEEGAAGSAVVVETPSSPSAPPPPPPPGSKPFDYPVLGGVPDGIDPARVTMLNDVNLGVRIELGRTKMLLEEVLRLGEGSVVELDRLAGDPVDVFANDRLIARGEVLVLNDSFCVRISEVFTRDPHRVVT